MYLAQTKVPLNRNKLILSAANLKYKFSTLTFCFYHMYFFKYIHLLSIKIPHVPDGF